MEVVRLVEMAVALAEAMTVGMIQEAAEMETGIAGDDDSQIGGLADPVAAAVLVIAIASALSRCAGWTGSPL